MAEFIGAVSASLHLTKEVIRYCQSFKSASAGAASLAQEVAAIAQVLQALRQSLQNPPPGISFQQTSSSSLLSSLQDCQRRMQDLEDSLAPHVSRLGRLFKRAKWPLEQRETMENVEALHRFIQIFHFATTLDGLAALSLPLGETLQKLDSLQQSHNTGQRQSEAAIRDIADTLRLLPQMGSQISGLTQRIDNFVIGIESHTQSQAQKEKTTSAYDELCRMLEKIPTTEFQDRHRTLQLTRMHGGSRWIFDAPNYGTWHSGSSSNTLWCNGGPGVGKTYLASVVIDELLLNSRGPSNCVVLFFYFDYSKQVDQTPLRVLQTLLHQLLSTHSHIPPLASKVAEDIMLGKPLPSFDDMKDLFVELCASGPPVFIVLDALDECDAVDNRKPILKLIESIKTSPARLLVTSRPYPPDVDEVLGDCPQVLVEASDKDIEKYVLEQIEGNVEMRRMLLDRDNLKQMIVRSILDKSQGMFLLPALQINNILGQTNVDEVQEALKTMPSGLADNLAMTIERIKKQQSQNQTRSRLAFLVLQWLATVRRPVTTKELQHALAARPGVRQLGALTDPKFFVESCFGLTIIDKETSVVRLVHFSVKEFLQEKRDELFDDPNSALAASCLTYMAVCIRRDRKFVQDATKPGETEAKSPLAHRWPFWQYAALNWGLHATESCAGLAEMPLRDFAFSQDLLDLWAGYVIFTRHSDKKPTGVYDTGWIKLASFVNKGASPLHIAAIYDLKGVAQECLTRGLDGNMRDGKGTTPFMLAAANNRNHILKMLLGTKSLDVNLLDENGHSALYHAGQRSHIEVLPLLLSWPAMAVNAGRVLECIHPDSLNVSGFETTQAVSMLLAHPDFDLHVQPHASAIGTLAAVARGYGAGDLEVARAMVGRPDFHVRKSSYEESQLNDTLSYMRNTDYDASFLDQALDGMCNIPAMILLMEKTFPDVSDLEPMRLLWPLVYYAHAGFYYPLPARDSDSDSDDDGDDDSGSDSDWPSEAALADLASEGYISSPVHVQPTEGTTPGRDLFGMYFYDDEHSSLQHAFRARMQSQGISFLTADSKGRGFLHAVCAAWETPFAAISLLFLLSIGMDVNLRDDGGQTPLHYLAAWADLDLVEMLVSAGADPRAADNDGWTVLHSAAKGNKMDVLTFLADQGADVLATTANGESVLSVAVEHCAEAGAFEMITYLIERGCRLDAADKFGFTAGFSSIWGSVEAMSACLDLGVDPFQATGPLGRSMLQACVQLAIDKKTALCLARLPPSPGVELNRLGCFGTSVLDYLSQFDRSTAAALGFTEAHWSTHVPTPPAARRRHLLGVFLARIGEMLKAPQGKPRREFGARAAHQLLLLGDERSARTILEDSLAPESRGMLEPFVLDTQCDGCDNRNAPLFYCRTCPMVTFCAGCRDAVPGKGFSVAVQCRQYRSHEFLEIPGPDWRDLPQGKVNVEGQTYDEFLEMLRERYTRELAKHQDHVQGGDGGNLAAGTTPPL